MVAEPAANPFTAPVLPTVAIDVLLLLHVPPDGLEDNVVALPTHTFIVPVIDDGIGLTVNVVVVRQPVGNVYVISGVPEATPVTIPELVPTVASVTLLLNHVPPGVASVSVVVKPMHTLSVPDIAAGNGLTVTTVVEVHPVDAV